MKNDFFDHLPPFYHPIPLFSGFIEFFYCLLEQSKTINYE